ncbi:MAG: YbjN domain-containing protein [Phycisphaerae bacterium]|nr:YbjN domain-containing protein [Phycisphaerae bacterium]
MEKAREIIDQVCVFLNEDGVRCHVRSDSPAIDTNFRGESGVFPVIIAARQDPAILAVMVGVPVVTPEPRRVQMAEAVARANHGLTLGCFDFDMSTGDMHFRVAMPLSDGALTHRQFRDLLGASITTAGKYHRAFCRLLFGDDLSPAEVIAEIEMADG